MLHLITSSCKSITPVLQSSFPLAARVLIQPCLFTTFISCITAGGYWDEKIWEHYLWHSHDWWQSGSLQCVCRLPKEQWCAWERGLSFHIPSRVQGFPLTPCPGLLPSCSDSLTSAAETSPGECSEWNLLSCLSSQRGASLIISDLSGVSFLLTLIFLEAVTWNYFGNTAFKFLSPSVFAFAKEM